MSHQIEESAMKIGRRSLLSAGAAMAVAPVIAGASSATDKGPRTRSKPSKMATYVLVHGGGHGGWCWERVATPLRAAGHRVYTPTLTGNGERSHLLNANIDLDCHITDVVNVIKWESLSDVILVGHSYGGMVITGIADRALDKIGHMVYLDAVHPRNGTGLWGPASAIAAAPAAGGAAAAAEGARPAAAGGTPAGAAPARGGGGAAAMMGAKLVNGVELVLFPDARLINGPLGVTKPEDVAWLMDKCTPQTLLSMTSPLHMQNEEAVHKLPTTDIWRKSILENQQAAKAKTGKEFSWAQRLWSIDSPSHDLMVTDPEPLTAMLLQIAAL
jgi:pimeloyl-ACP methyl ester carboxylesterase